MHFCTKIRNMTIRKIFTRNIVQIRDTRVVHKAYERNFCVSGRTSLGPLLRDENINGNLTDGDDELLESLVKTATKTPATRTTPRERKRTRHADRKSCKCDPRTLHPPSLLPRWSICPRFFLQKIDRLLANSLPACSPGRIYGPISSRTHFRGVSFQRNPLRNIDACTRALLPNSISVVDFGLNVQDLGNWIFLEFFLRIICCNRISRGSGKFFLIDRVSSS